MNKDKIIMIISIGFTALVLSAVTFTQFKTVEQTDITAIETMRETELRTELSAWKTKYDEISLKLDETQTKLDEYKTELSNVSDASSVAKQEVASYEKALGYTDVQGQGIIITLEDNEYKNIESYDLLMLVNELKLAGAEAISINGQRILANTAIRCVGPVIQINGVKVAAPFSIKAIGNAKYLESALNIKGGIVDSFEIYGIQVNITTEKDITISKHDGKLSFSKATVAES
jgi:uncharacterized protein YlxW (UPF0749 family)